MAEVVAEETAVHLAREVQVTPMEETAEAGAADKVDMMVIQEIAEM